MGTTPMRTAGIRWAATGAAALLLAGCGAAEDAATALDKAQVASVLPDEDALPGWGITKKPSAAAMDEVGPGAVCLSAKNEGCEDSAFLGSVSFQRDDENARASFWMVAYKDEKATEAAYDVLWKQTARTAGKDEADLGSPGAERDAAAGPMGYDGAYAVTGQIRVGTALLWVSSDARSEKALDRDLVKDLAALFSDRAQQAQNGEEPSARL
ncbi:hypothetical protein OHT61_15770 [Streptomyces sp. NBC_00178]|uniref:hypothetical protein n=1 Tax=Streptomyces sp. NBC_00178 TaxID=2975672 RepID=UPI002E2E88DB|nr:hypothetical protein [Streptomyces sp. NBC_00178]